MSHRDNLSFQVQMVQSQEYNDQIEENLESHVPQLLSSSPFSVSFALPAIAFFLFS